MLRKAAVLRIRDAPGLGVILLSYMLPLSVHRIGTSQCFSSALESFNIIKFVLNFLIAHCFH